MAIRDVKGLLARAEAELAQTVWPAIDGVYYAVFERVLDAFARHRVGEEHFASVTGYGHDDLGRETLDTVFADALQAEAALARFQFVSGTHALSVALNGCLQAGDAMVAITGPPYDTLEEVIGLRGESPLSLIARGVRYAQFDCCDGLTDPARQALASAKMAYIQRSRGYSLRRALTIADIEALCADVRAINPGAIILVDNCYGEFVETREPTAVGADLIAGSLIKNPGGGLVPTGGYIAGRRDRVAACADALTAPGVGASGGYTFDLARLGFQGLFLAPNAVREALKSMTLAAWLFQAAGFDVNPHADAARGDIIQTVALGDPQRVQTFCSLLQSASPINAAVKPIPATIPGYADPVIMAGGTFIQGATLELSADAPLREPYTVFLQGGLCYAHARVALTRILQALNPSGG